MRLPALDERLSKAAALFPACAYGADIGADHGRLSCYLLASGKCQRMCVADISAESLEKARKLLALHGLSDHADISVGDGLFAMEKDAQAIAILGMGGRTLSEILQKGAARLKGATLVLSAHTQLSLVRNTLMKLGYRIDREEVVRAAGRFYVVLRAVPGNVEYTEQEMVLGPLLKQNASLEYTAYLEWRMGAVACKRTEESKQELEWLKEEYARACQCGNASESDQ
ncbi:MAG: SAM-dependent methyltransferase [Clostridiales bacterium]|nr:SAM-dependent methyltransferase [Clostridiales bacterium]